MAATEGNLGAHITTLEEAGYVAVEKDFVAKRPRTRIALTKHGRRAFEDYVAYLRDIIDAALKLNLARMSSGVTPASRNARKRDGAIALGKFPALLVQDQPVMGVSGRRQSEQRLQQALDMGGREQIVAARHQRDALEGIVHHHGQMIGRGHLLARQHDVAEQQRIHRDAPVSPLARAALLEESGPACRAAFAASSRSA